MADRGRPSELLSLGAARRPARAGKSRPGRKALWRREPPQKPPPNPRGRPKGARYDVKMARTKATVYLDPEVLRATRVKAARTGKRDSDVVEEALREHLGFAVLDRVRARSTLSPEEAERLAYEELHALREKRQRTQK